MLESSKVIKEKKYDLLINILASRRRGYLYKQFIEITVKPKTITDVLNYFLGLTCEIYIDSSCKLGLILLFI